MPLSAALHRQHRLEKAELRSRQLRVREDRERERALRALDRQGVRLIGLTAAAPRSAPAGSA